MSRLSSSFFAVIAMTGLTTLAASMQGPAVTVTGDSSPTRWSTPSDSSEKKKGIIGDPAGRMEVPVSEGDVVAFVTNSGTHRVIFESAKSEQAAGTWELATGQLENLPAAKYYKPGEAQFSVSGSGNLVSIRVKKLGAGQSILFACNPHSLTNGANQGIPMLGKIVPKAAALVPQAKKYANILDAPIAEGVPQDDQSKALVKLVRRCGTVAPEESRRSALRLRTAPFRVANLRTLGTSTITVSVYFHVITNGSVGEVTDAQIKQQINVLNADYKPYNVQFELKTTTRTDVADPAIAKPGWFTMGVNSADEIDAKTTLGVDPARNLNLYTAEPSDPVLGGLLGFSTFPWELAGNPKRDGVVILHSSLPGGTPPFNLGKTATHEVGHWLGLYHTFQGGCTPPGDEVDDTQAQPDGNNIFQCDPATNICPGGDPARAPVHNYMNYADDSCLTEFTPGQRDRMKVEVSLYRTLLVESDTRKALRTFSTR